MIITDKSKLIQKCEPVSSPAEALEISDKLSSALTTSPEAGIGLAANQIGINKQVCIIRIPESDRQGFRYEVEIILANPEILALSKPVRFTGEGCLSFPGQKSETLRYAKCTVKDLLQPEGRTFEGLRAICAQHEIQHLSGGTMFDSLLESVKPNSACPCGRKLTFKECCRGMLRDF